MHSSSALLDAFSVHYSRIKHNQILSPECRQRELVTNLAHSKCRTARLSHHLKYTSWRGLRGCPSANTNLNAASQDGTKVKDVAVGRFGSLDYQNDARQSFRLTRELQKVREELKSGVKPADFEDLLQCLANEDFWALARSCLPILRGDSGIDDLESTPEATACVASRRVHSTL
ncbi:hypothetical protein LTR15_009439 [Elasticomyces elasticus]|nr:hypothetical protein LTR15_009439 [Elasticomyces elasticus]